MPVAAIWLKPWLKSDTFDGLFCPVGGNEAMARIATILGREAVTQEARVAVLRCNGTCEYRPRTNHYDGIPSCAIVSALYGGETGCSYGCMDVVIVWWSAVLMPCIWIRRQDLPVVDDKNALLVVLVLRHVQEICLN